MTILISGHSADRIGDEPTRVEDASDHASSTLVENVADASFETPVENRVQNHFQQKFLFPDIEQFYSVKPGLAHPGLAHIDDTHAEATTTPVEPTASTLLSPPPKQIVYDEHGNIVPRIIDGDTAEIGAADIGQYHQDICYQGVDFSVIDIDRKYVRAICRKYEGRGVTSDDLWELAIEGIYKAAERFDSTKGAQFQSYATWWIRERILDRFKKLKSETEYLSDFTKGQPIGSLAEGFEEVSVAPSYYRNDGTIDEEFAELEEGATEIPKNLADLYLDHICTVAESVMKGIPRVADYHRMLSSKPAEKWKPSDIVDRESNFIFFESIIRSVVREKHADILLKRFGIECESFADIAKQHRVSYNKIRSEFYQACKELIYKINSLHRVRMIKSFRAALIKARKPVM